MPSTVVFQIYMPSNIVFQRLFFQVAVEVLRVHEEDQESVQPARKKQRASNVQSCAVSSDADSNSDSESSVASVDGSGRDLPEFLSAQALPAS